jgi:hypothetical protein
MNKTMYLLLSLTLLIGCNNSAGVAGQDSAVAGAGIPGSGKDLYYQYTITGGGKAMRMNGSMKMYLAADGHVRMEMLMGIDTNGAKATVPSIVVLGNSHTPTETISVDDAAKTFTRNHFDTSDVAGLGRSSTIVVTKVGEDTWMGFHCVHARIINTISMGHIFTMVDTTDIWKSKDVPMQEGFRHWMDKFEEKTNASIYSPKVAEELKEMGCEGMFVRMESSSKDSHTRMALSKVEHRDLPANLFVVPAGYTEDKNN